MVFIEMASFVGDVLAFYQDTQLKESMLLNASESKNVVSIAQALGDKPKVTSPAVTSRQVRVLAILFPLTLNAYVQYWLEPVLHLIHQVLSTRLMVVLRLIIKK